MKKFHSNTSQSFFNRCAGLARVLVFGAATGLLFPETARAGFYSVSWFSSAFLLSDTSVEPDNAVSIADGIPGGQVLYALYYTPTAGGQFLTPTQTAGAGPVTWSGFAGNPGGDDRLVLVARDNEVLGSTGGNISEDFSGQPLGNLALQQTGYFYSIAFQFNDSSVDLMDESTWNFSVPAGTRAYISPTTSVSFIPPDTPFSPREVSASAGGNWTGVEGDGTAGSAVAQTVMIPEPASVVLILLGVLYLAGRKNFIFTRSHH